MSSQQVRTPKGNANAGRGARTGTRTTRKPGARKVRPPAHSKRRRSGLWAALLGAFLLGGVYGAIQVEYPWHGVGILANVQQVLGYGLGLGLLMAIIWSLTAIRKWVAALIWRKRV